MPSVTGPDGRKLNFPEGTPQETVMTVLQQQYPESFSGQPAGADFSNVQARVDSTEPRAERDASGQLTEYGQRVQAVQSETRATMSPTVGMSGVDRFRAGFGKSFADAGRGLYQAGVDSANRTLGAGYIGLNAVGAPGAAASLARNVGAPVARESQRLEGDEADRRRLDAPLMDTGAGLGGNVAGTLTQFIGPGIAGRGTMAGAALLPRTIRGNAALGTVAGFAQPNTGAGDQAANTGLGGVLSAAGAAVPRVATAAGGYLNRMRTGLDPLTQRAGGRLRDAATNPGALDIQASAIPGVNRTLGEATTDPGLQGLERTLRQQNQGVFQQVDRGNNMARSQYVEGQAMSPGQRADAVAARSDAATDARDRAMQAGPVDTSGALAYLDDLIARREGNREAQGALQDIKQRFQRITDSGDIAPEDRIAVIDELRQVVGREIGNAADDKALQGALIEFRNTLNRDVGGQVPEFANYLDAYRSRSRDINRSDIWTEIADRGSTIPDAETGYRTLTPGQFFRATNDLDTLAQRATDFGAARADQILAAPDMYAIRALSDDLARVASRQQSPAVGSNTAGHLVNLARQMGRGATSGTPLIGQSIDAALGALDGATQQRLMYLVTNPAEAQRVLQAMPTRDREALQSVLTQLAVAGPAQATRAGTPELVN